MILRFVVQNGFQLELRNWKNKDT